MDKPPKSGMVQAHQKKKNERKWREPGAKAHQVQLDNFEHSTQKDSQLKLWLSLKKTLKL
jgi:hypothetical protein